jgi:uncharacterized protein (TIRG00374 family)
MTQPKKENSSKSFSVWLRLLVMLITGGVVYHLVEWKNVWQGLSDLTATIVVLGVGVCMARSGLQGWRWKWLNSDASGSFSIWDYIVYTLSSNTFNLVMPGGLGGDFIRSVLIYKNAEGKKGENVLSVWTDRLLGLFSILCLGAIVGIFTAELPNRCNYLLLIGVLLAGFVFLFILSVNNSWLSWLVRHLKKCGKPGHVVCSVLDTMRSAVQYYRQNPSCILKALVICIPIHMCSFLVFYIIMTALGAGLNFFQVMAVASLLWVILAIPVSIAGFGVRELTLVYLLAPYGVSASLATAISLGYFAVGVALGTVGIPFVYLAIKNKRTGLKNKYESI